MTGHNGFNHELEWTAGARVHRALLQDPEDAKFLHSLLAKADTRVEHARVICVVVDSGQEKIGNLDDARYRLVALANKLELSGKDKASYRAIVDAVLRIIHGLEATVTQLRDDLRRIEDETQRES